MSAVDKIIGEQVEKAAKDARRQLRQAAEQTLYYLADGNVMKKEISEKYEITEHMAEQLVRANAMNLGESIRRL